MARLDPLSMAELLNLQGKCQPLRAKPAHFVSHLPIPTSIEEPTPQFTTQVVIDLNVRRNQPQCSNFAFKVRASKNLRSSCRSRGERCLGANGNSSYIFSTVKYTVIIKYSKVWKWCRTFSANFFDSNVRHQACLRSICVEHSGQLPPGGKRTTKDIYGATRFCDSSGNGQNNP